MAVLTKARHAAGRYLWNTPIRLGHDMKGIQMLSDAILFQAPWQATFAQNIPVADGPLADDAVVIQTQASIVSPGTELAILSGGESWAPLPFVPGYGSVGQIVEVGSAAAKTYRLGDRVLTQGQHARRSRSLNLITPLPDGLDAKKAVFARIGQIGMTALRISQATPGDFVAVLGLGLVGNLTAQLLTLAGCRVIGIDLEPKRRQRAQTCGIEYCFSPQEASRDAISELTQGRLCTSVVEATGVPQVALDAADLAGPGGEVILLGSPRGSLVTDVTPLLNKIHLWGHGCVTFKGAHEWRLPLHDDPSGHQRFSMESNVRQLVDWIAQDKLKTEPLTTHVVPPSKASEVYRGLKQNGREYLGVVFDWTQG